MVIYGLFHGFFSQLRSTLPIKMSKPRVVSQLGNQSPQLRCCSFPEKGSWAVHEKHHLFTAPSVHLSLTSSYSGPLLLTEPHSELGLLAVGLWKSRCCPAVHLMSSPNRRPSSSASCCFSFLPLTWTSTDGSPGADALGTPEPHQDLPCWGPLCRTRFSGL